MTHIGLNTSEHERSAPTGGNPLPAGLYTGIVTRTQMKKNSDKAKDPNGQYLEVEFDISGPSEYNNRKFWDKFNLMNANMQTVTIAKEQLADLAKAAGLQVLNEDTDLHGKEVAMVLKVNPPKGNFQASNECTKYWPLGTTMADHDFWLKSKKSGSGQQKSGWGQQPAQTQATSTSPSTQKASPWARK